MAGTGTEMKLQGSNIHLIECPRDAMQGWKKIIPTEKKISYINSLLKVGFHTLDCGSFVSPKTIPQMADTKEVLANISLANSQTKLLAIVANQRGANDAVSFENITYLGFPFSVSPTFQLRNTNCTIEESLDMVEAIQELCQKHDKQLVVYLSMGFGNPYGDEYNKNILLQRAQEIVERGITIISLADTVGVALPEQISVALKTLVSTYPRVEFGVHLHAAEARQHEKLFAAASAGCKRFDGALKGIGGCPLAGDDLVGNMDTECIIAFFKSYELLPTIDLDALQTSLDMAAEIFKS